MKGKGGSEREGREEVGFSIPRRLYRVYVCGGCVVLDEGGTGVERGRGGGGGHKGWRERERERERQESGEDVSTMRERERERERERKKSASRGTVRRCAHERE